MQLCNIHMVLKSEKFVPWKDYKALAADLKRIYQSVREQDASLELDSFAEKWDEKYLQISKSWRANLVNLITIFDHPADIRKVIYTTDSMSHRIVSYEIQLEHAKLVKGWYITKDEWFNHWI